MKSIIEYQLHRVSTKIFDRYEEILLSKIGERSGIYVLYKGNAIYYVGKATVLDSRLRQHFKDRHKNKWDFFSVYVVNERYIEALEKLLISLLKPKGNNLLYEKARKQSEKDLKNEISVFQKEEISEMFSIDKGNSVKQKWAKKDLKNKKERPRFSFWESFKIYAKEHNSKFSLRNISDRHWHDISFGSYRSHIRLCALFKEQQVSCEIYISDDKKLFTKLYKNKKKIEKEIGEKLDWQFLKDKKASRIKLEQSFDIAFLMEKEKSIKFLFDRASKFHKIFPKYIKD